MAGDPQSFLDENFLRQLEKLRIITRKGVKGPEKGEHRSLQSAEGLEFLDYRKYHAGDDLRYVDWSVYGRLDKLFIKLFHTEESQIAHVLLDMSRSMGSGSPSKETVAKKIAAATAYICLSNLDKIGLVSFSDTIKSEIRPIRGKKKFPEMLDFLAALKPSNQTDLNACLSAYATTCRNPGIAIVISDLFDSKGCTEGLKALVYRKFDVNLIQVLDHEELFWSKTGNFLLEDVETGERKTTFLDRTALVHYRKRLDDFMANIQNICGNYGINYYRYDTSIPFEDFLIDYVAKRAAFK